MDNNNAKIKLLRSEKVVTYTGYVRMYVCMYVCMYGVTESRNVLYDEFEPLPRDESVHEPHQRLLLLLCGDIHVRHLLQNISQIHT